MGDQFLSMHEPAAGVLSPKRTDGETIKAVAEEKNRDRDWRNRISKKRENGSVIQFKRPKQLRRT